MGFRQSGFGQVDIGPSGEAVFPVPLAFAVTKQHELVHCGALRN
jgi:hypothetical protein